MDTSVNAANQVVSVGADIALDADHKFFACLVRFESSSVFFFQAEDGIRDDLVTGVQTCALPIYRGLSVNEIARVLISMMARSKCSNQRPDTLMQDRSPPARRNPLATHGRTIHPGQTRKCARSRDMSVRPSGADIVRLHAQVRFVPFAIFCTAVYSTLFDRRSTMAPRLLSASNRRGIVRFGDQHYLGGHRSWT